MAITTKPNYDKEKLLIDIKRKLKEGNTQYSITEWVKENYQISNQSLIFAITEAKELLSRELDFNYRDIMIKHAGRYEEIWKKNFMNPFSKQLEKPDDDLEDQDVRKTLFKIRNHYLAAAEALRAKERMLGIVHNRMDVDLKNEFSEQEEKNKPKNIMELSSFDLTKLTFEEKLEFLSLLKKAKGEEQPQQQTKVTTTISISQNQVKEEAKFEEVVSKFDIEDIEHEEVIEPPRDIIVGKINETLIKEEAKKLEDKLAEQREIKKKQDFEAAKKKVLEKYKKLK